MTNLIDSVISVQTNSPDNFWEFLGFSNEWGLYLSNFFSVHTFLRNLGWINFILTLLFALLTISLIILTFGVIRYLTKERKIMATLKLFPLALNKNALIFFEKYCKRNSNGTYECSLSKHKKLHSWGRASLGGAVTAFILKVVVVALILSVNAGFLQASRDSANYSIFIDAVVGGGGNLSSTNYVLDSGFGEPIASNKVSSTNYTEYSGITAITDEPSIAISIDTTPISFGIVTNAGTSYDSHTFSAYFNGISGYDIVLQGSPPTNGAGDIINGIGTTAVVPASNTEQFGINLAGNTVPAVIGADPLGGNASATAQYGQTNKYAYNIGDVIATSSTESTTTTFTSTIIMNIDQNTPAGNYIANLVYTMVGKF